MRICQYQHTSLCGTSHVDYTALRGFNIVVIRQHAEFAEKSRSSCMLAKQCVKEQLNLINYECENKLYCEPLRKEWWDNAHSKKKQNDRDSKGMKQNVF